MRGVLLRLLLCLGLSACTTAVATTADPTGLPAAAPLSLNGRLSDLKVEPQPNGQTRIRIGGESFTPDAFARRLLREQTARTPRGWLYRVLNITTPVGVLWVALGLLGQVLFTGRMVVQWLVSERARKSVVPPAFWWMSLGGAAMLLAYFAWRKDIVGLLGQSTGFAIYARNLWLLHRRPVPAQA